MKTNNVYTLTSGELEMIVNQYLNLTGAELVIYEQDGPDFNPGPMRRVEIGKVEIRTT